MRAALYSMALCPRLARIAFAMILALSAIRALADSNVPAREANLAIVGVTVIPMDSERVLPEQTVLVREGRIVRIGPAVSVVLPHGARVVSGQGRYLIPGLADMHVHITGPDEMLLLLANGVTLARAMWGEKPILVLREHARVGRIVGPRLIVGSRIVDGVPAIHFGSYAVNDEKEAAHIVENAKTSGYDFIKIYSNLSLPVFDSIISTAHRVGIPVAGHVPLAVSLTHAIDSGLASVEHLTGFNAATAPQGSKINLESWYTPSGQKLLRALGRGEIKRDEVFDGQKLDEIAAIAARSAVWNVPTLIQLQRQTLSPEDLENTAARPEMHYMSPMIRAFWNRSTRSFLSGRDADQRRGVEILFDQQLRQVAALAAAQAGILSGTDSPNPYVFTGFSIHEELALLVRAGLSPYQALRSATGNPAKYLNEGKQFGTVREGARADLLLLDANPLVAIGNTQRIVGVVSDGRWYPNSDLRARLETLASQYARLEGRFSSAPPLTSGSESAAAQIAAFTLIRGGRDVGAERIALVPGSDNGHRLRAQQIFGAHADGGIILHEIELDKEGELQRYSEQWSAPDIRTSVLERQPNGSWMFSGSSVGGASAVQHCDTVVGGTAADATIIFGVLRSLSENATRALTVCSLAGRDHVISHETWMIHREHMDTIIALGLIIGANRYRIEIRVPRGERHETIWMGGGLFEGTLLSEIRKDGRGGIMELSRYQ